VYAHYCDDELQETSLLVNTNESCCAEDTDEAEGTLASSENDMSCCAEQNVLVKIEDQFVKSELSFIAIDLPVFYFAVSYVNEFNTGLFANTSSNYTFLITDPPDRSSPNINILYSIFRI
jgi:hypothetical protein